VTIGTQAEEARIPFADGTLVPTPGQPNPELIPSLLAASDVLGTGWFAAVAAEAGPGKTVAVVGDGAVGLMGILVAKQLDAERIIAMSRHPERQELARFYGATDIVEERGAEGVAKLKELTACRACGAKRSPCSPSQPRLLHPSRAWRHPRRFRERAECDCEGVAAQRRRA
jgi:threonine dehydrogenase-like Zn-dependent dehydrogenase